MNYMFDYVMIPIQLIIFFFTIYYFVIAFFGVWKRNETKILTPKKTFAVLIAAHNEEQVIGQLVDNLHQLDYPKDMYDIYVVADNCTDKTAQIAQSCGAIVCERTNDKERGKGFAMEWMFAKLFTFERQYDAVAVFDADNLVHPRFLLEMNNRLCKGDKLVQGYLDAKNPHDTWVSGTFAIAFWMTNHIWHLAKSNIGLSSVLGGTGMCISTDILKEFGWGATCLTEDMEFTMKVLTKGIRTTWAHDAIVYDEKPLTFAQAWNQRKRWAQGHFDIAGRYIPTMFKEGIKQRNIRIVDGCVHLLQPHFLLISTAFVIASYIQMMVPPFYTNIYSLMPAQIVMIVMVGQYLLPIVILLRIKAKPKTWFYLILYPVFIYSWIPITFLGFLHRKNHEWSHTKHTRALTYEELMARTNGTDTVLNKELSK